MTEDEWEDRKERWLEHDRKTKCQQCGEYVYDLFEAERDGQTLWICEDCSNDYLTCEVCEIYVHPDYVSTPHCERHKQ